MQRYSEDHLWVRMDGPVATLGISRHAADELGDLTFVELPALESRLQPGDVLCVVESVKTAADIACPVGGTVHEVNRELAEHPALVNAGPEDIGWICRLRDVPTADFDRLMTALEYAGTLQDGAGPAAPREET